MEEMKSLCACLTSTEVKFIRQYYELNGGEENIKKLQLLNLIKKKKDLTDEKASLILYNKQPDGTFRKLMSRLQEDLLRLLVIQDSSKYFKSPYRKAEIQCRRLLMEGDILLKRGAYKLAVKILRRALRKAEKYELVSEGILIEDILRTHLGFKKGLKTYESFTESMRSKLWVLSYILEAKRLYNNVLLPNVFSSNESKQFIEITQETFDQLKLAYQRTKSPNVGYLYHLIGLYYYDFVRDLKSALEMSIKFKQLIEDNEAIFSSTRIANANLQIANILINMKHFDEASEYANEAANNFRKGMMNQLLALEQLFFANLRSGKMELTEETLSAAIIHPKLKSSKLIYAKWMYYKAAFEFEKRNYDTALDTLFLDNTLYKDKPGWNIGQRLLEIMIFIETDQYDLIEFRIESLRKQLQRQKDRKFDRMKLIMRILTSFVRNDFDFEKTNFQNEKEIDSLLEAKDNYYWDPLGFEIIRFDKWFKSKLVNVNTA